MWTPKKTAKGWMAQNDETMEYDNAKPFKSKLDCLKFIQTLQAKESVNAPAQAPSLPQMASQMGGSQMPPGMPMSGNPGLPSMPPPRTPAGPGASAVSPLDMMMQKRKRPV